jgi:hypothetical protein
MHRCLTVPGLWMDFNAETYAPRPPTAVWKNADPSQSVDQCETVFCGCRYAKNPDSREEGQN